MEIQGHPIADSEVSADAIEAIGLGRRFRMKWGLKNCSFSIPKGKVAALVGPNGAGKTTFIRIQVHSLGRSNGDPTYCAGKVTAD